MQLQMLKEMMFTRPSEHKEDQDIQAQSKSLPTEP